MKKWCHFVDPNAQAETMLESHPWILKPRPVPGPNDRRSAAGASPPGAERQWRASDSRLQRPVRPATVVPSLVVL